jgi:integrase
LAEGDEIDRHRPIGRRWCFHDLRHTRASLLLARGTPVLDVSRRIGHASAAMTLDVYGHVVPGQGQRAAAAFADLVEGGR